MRLLFFASLRDRLGRSEQDVVLPDGIGTVSGLLDWLRSADPEFASIDRENQRIRVAVNRRFASGADPVAAGDEVALFPPVTGG